MGVPPQVVSMSAKAARASAATFIEAFDTLPARKFRHVSLAPTWRDT